MMNFCIKNYDVDFKNSMEGLRIVDISASNEVPNGVVISLADPSNDAYTLYINPGAKGGLEVALSDM